MTMQATRKHEVKFGSYLIPDVVDVQIELVDGDAEALRQGHAGRGDRQGVRQYALTSLHGGLGILRGSEIAHGTRFRESQGLITHIENGAYLPPRVQSQAAETAVDVSGYAALNRRWHQASSTLGQSKRREYFGLGPKFKRTVSDTDHALETTGLSLTDNICCIGEGVFNSTRYIVCGTDGTTDDVFGIADPTLSPPVKTTLFALSSGDWVGGYWYMPNLGPGYNFFYGKIGGVTGLFFLRTDSALLTAPSPVVLTSTKDVLGNLASVTTSEITLSLANEYDPVAGEEPWGTTSASTTLNYGYKWGFITTDPGIPRSAYILGIQPDITYDEEETVTRLESSGVRIFIAGQATGASFGSTELSTDSTQTLGGASTTFGTDLRGADIRSFSLRVGKATMQPNGAGNPDGYDITGMDVAFTYQMPGVQASLPLGGTCFGVDPLNATRVRIRAPEFQDDTTGVNVPRILWTLEFQYDPDGERPTVSLSKEPTNLRHVECGNYTAGGMAVFGDTVAGVAAVGKFLLDGRTPSDIPFKSRDQGYTEAWGVVDVIPSDRGCVFLAVNEAATVMQWWIWNSNNDSVHPFGPRETITSQPLRSSRSDVGAELRRRYAFFATSTNTSVSRAFQARNVFENPLTNNTSEVKANGPMSVTLPDLDLLGPPERNKSVLVAWFLGRDVSASNTVKLEYSTDGGSNWTTWTTFTAFGAKSTLATPVNFRYMMLRVSADHTADSTGTPNCLGPILIEGYSGWRKLRRVTVLFNSNGEFFRGAYEGGTPQLMTLLQTQENSGPVNTLTFGPVSYLAEMLGGNAKVLPRQLGQSFDRRMETVRGDGGKDIRQPKPVIDQFQFLEVAS